jgi:hypothetical protein
MIAAANVLMAFDTSSMPTRDINKGWHLGAVGFGRPDETAFLGKVSMHNHLKLNPGTTLKNVRRV